MSEAYNFGYNNPNGGCPFEPINNRGYSVWNSGRNLYIYHQYWYKGANDFKKGFEKEKFNI